MTHRWFTVFGLVMAFLVGPPWCHAADAPRGTYQRGVLIELHGMVSPQMEKYLERKLAQARKLNADLVILEVDSPGGYLDATLEMAAQLRDLTWAHTVAFVPNEALSGAAILALGCDEIVMAPNARLGDAGPIIQGADALFRHAPEKIRSDLARRVRDLATAKHRPPALAEAMVDMDLAVYRMTNKQTGAITYMSDSEIASLEDPENWEKGKRILESREKKFLEVNGRRAVQLHLASAVVRDRTELAQRYRLREPLVVLRHTGVDTAVIILNSPLVTSLLFVIGLVALYIEFSAPGIGLGGLVAGLCFTLFFWSRFLGGTAGWLEVILFLAGLAFLGIELFVIPGFGVAGLTGILLLIASIVMASQAHVVPQSPRALEQAGRSLLALLGALFGFGICVTLLTRYYGSVPLFGRLVLRATPDIDDVVSNDDPKLHVVAAGPVQVGDWGVSESPLRPAGKAQFHNENVDVVTEGAFVEPGRQVRVVKIQGNRVVVREVASDTDEV